jgi:enoyl-CoA hydratase
MQPVLCERSDGVAVITLNRPEKHNALNPEMVVRLADLWSELAEEAQIRAVVITGAGEQTFSAGADLGRLMPLLTRAREPEDEWDERVLADRSVIDGSLLRTASFFKPVIAAVNGRAIAGGTELLLATDIRIAAAHATFGLTEVRRGLIPAGGSLTRIARQLSWADAMEIVLVGEPVAAEHALRIGLINRVVDRGQELPTALEFARRIALGGPLALSKAKEVIVRSNGLPLEQAFQIENQAAKEVGRSEDAREGPRAFMEKREPVFVGR